MLTELSRAELEVAKLLTEGLSDRRIADRLSKSIRTIQNQIASILDKCDCASRLEFVARIRGQSHPGSGDTSESVALERIDPELFSRLTRQRQILMPDSTALSFSGELLRELPAAIEAVVVRALSGENPHHNQRIAVLGITRTGLALASVAKDRGNDPILVADPLATPSFSATSQLAEAQIDRIVRELRIPVIRNWSGSLRELSPDLILTAPSVSVDHPALVAPLRDGIPVLSEAEYACRISKAPIVVISGSLGKTTTAVMASLMLQAAGIEAVLCGSIFGTGYEERTLIEAAHDSKDSQVLVAEIGAAELSFTKELRPRVAAITNVYTDRGSTPGSYSDHARAYRRLLNQLGAGDTVVCNAGQSETWPSPRKRPKMLRWSSAVPSSDSDSFQTEEGLVILGHRIPFQDLPFAEPENYENMLCASLIAVAAGADRHDKSWILKGLHGMRIVWHRFEQVGSKFGVTFVNNSACTNPAALAHIVRSESGPLRLLLGGVSKGLNLGNDVRTAIAGHYVYLYGQDAPIFNADLGGAWPVFNTMEEALSAAISDAVSGDTVMLAPAAASTDQFCDFRERGDRFKFLVRQWLET